MRVKSKSHRGYQGNRNILDRTQSDVEAIASYPTLIQRVGRGGSVDRDSGFIHRYLYTQECLGLKRRLLVRPQFRGSNSDKARTLPR